jgi:hypothetical protein
MAIPSPVQLTVALVKDTASQSLPQGVLTACLQTLQQQAAQQQLQPVQLQAGLCLVSSCVVPPVLHVLSSGGYGRRTNASGNTDVLALQLIFLLFNLLPDDALKTVLLHASLSSLCGFLESNDASSAQALLCGKGVTHIARSAPQIFRGEIMLLPEASRATLQHAMRSVLEAMNQPGAGGGGQAGASGSAGGAAGSPQKIGAGSSKEGGVKKIDMSKYRGGS